MSSGSDPTPKSSSRGGWLALIVSIVIGVVLLILAGRNLDFERIGQYLTEVDLLRVGAALAVYALLFGVVHLLRMWRWAFLLAHLGEFRLREVLSAAAIGFTAIILLPLRLGELVRPFVLSRDTGCSATAALGTAVVERVVDGLFITFLLFITLATYDGDGSTLFAQTVGYVSLGIFSGALVVCVLGMWRREWAVGLVAGILSRISEGLSEKLIGILEAFLDGVESIKKGRALVPFLILTASYWGLNGLSIALLGWWGFGLAIGPWAGLTVLAILVIGIMIPTGPGLAGNYELFALEALGLFVPAAQVSVEGAAFVALMHAAQFTVQVIPGLWLLWRRRDGLMALRREASEALGGG